MELRLRNKSVELFPETETEKKWVKDAVVGKAVWLFSPTIRTVAWGCFIEGMVVQEAIGERRI